MFRVTRLVLLVITVMDATAVITAITSHTTTQLLVVHITIAVVHVMIAALMAVHLIVTVVLVTAMDVMVALAVLDARTVLDARLLVQETVKVDAMADV